MKRSAPLQRFGSRSSVKRVPVLKYARDRVLQMLETDWSNEQKYFGVAEHGGRLSEQYRPRFYLGAKPWTIGLVFKHPNGVGERKTYDASLLSRAGAGQSQHIDRRKFGRLGDSVERLDVQYFSNVSSTASPRRMRKSRLTINSARVSIAGRRSAQ